MGYREERRLKKKLEREGAKASKDRGSPLPGSQKADLIAEFDRFAFLVEEKTRTKGLTEFMTWYEKIRHLALLRGRIPVLILNSTLVVLPVEDFLSILKEVKK